MRKVLIGIMCTGVTLFAAQNSGTFSKVFGGDEDDVAKAVVRTENGFMIAGKTKSFTQDRDFDAYLINIDKNGKKIWSKVYGGEDDEEANAIVRQGNDYVFMGSTETYGNERMSFYMVKVNSEGKPYWQTTFYRDDSDEYYGTAVVADGEELVFAGYERHLQFFDEDLSPYIFKTDKDGDKVWGGYYGGKDDDRVYGLIAADNGYLAVGDTESYGHGDRDAYMVKLDKSGKKEWHAAFGGKDDDSARAVLATKDGYLLVGNTDSFGRNYMNAYVVKTDKKGKLLWEKSYGGSHEDEAFAVAPSADGGFVVVGRSESFTRRNGFDLYLFKIDSNGKLLWERTYGGEADDVGYDIVALEDGYLIVGDKKTDRRRDSDVWVLKVDLKGRL
ncbi:hypothetical protein [Sulfurovum sp. NBC37-1]|uniref:hypothetical protein n=1 Tax=Sulfurovum sp. (strain NBC37-1) TaxID=387093 RepID=UPI0001587631|nr:hypothetical protein [Sulfurovum sp. NBC37-1]BAF71544.1 hypothetical protein SUN_0585 [Sulfurovum sp. NBC37-1]